MLLDEEVSVVSNGATWGYYRALGYAVPNAGEYFKIKTIHLPPNSRQKLRVQCEECSTEYLLSSNAYSGNLIRNNGTYRCNSCSTTARNKAGARSLKEAQELYIKAGLDPLFTTYTENKEKLPYRCPRHPEEVRYKATNNVLTMVRHGHTGCPLCAKERNDAIKATPFIEVVPYYNRFDVTFLSMAAEYEKGTSKLRYVCNVHPEYGEQKMAVQQAKFAKNICVLCARAAFSGRGHPNHQPHANINNHLRQALDVWRESTFFLFDYKCDVSGARGGKLVVHHLIAMHKIRDAVLLELGLNKTDKLRSDFTEKELAEITDLFVLKHYEQPIGVVLDTKVHKLYHAMFGHKTRNTMENYYVFKRMYQKGEIAVPA